MEKKDRIVLEGPKPIGDFFQFEKEFFECMKKKIGEERVEYKALIEPEVFSVVMECSQDVSDELLKAVCHAVQTLNNPWKTSDTELNVQAKQVLKKGILTLNGVTQKLMPAQLPDCFVFDGIATAHKGR